MKRTNRFFGWMLTFLMLLGCIAPLTASAANEYTITISDAASVSVQGKTFEAYRLFDVTYSTDGDGNVHYAYKVVNNMKTWVSNELSISASLYDFDERISAAMDAMADNSAEAFAFANNALTYVKNPANGISPVVTQTAGAVATSVTLDVGSVGYYLVADTSASGTISAVILSTVSPAATVTLKADQPTLTKKIVTGVDTTADTNNVSIGESITYKISTRVPDMTGYTAYTYQVNDTFAAGFTFQTDSVVVKLDGTTLTKNTDYTLTSAGTAGNPTTMTIDFTNFISRADKSGKTIEITYSAILNQYAVIGTSGNANTATLTYSNQPGAATTETSAGDTVLTYTTEIKIAKVDAEADSLSGAKFKLTRDGKTYLMTATEVTDGNGKKVNRVLLTDDAAGTAYAEAFVSDDGLLTFTGLGAGSYTIEETQAPSGYHKLGEAIMFTIAYTAPAGEIINGTESCTWGYTAVGTSGTIYAVDASTFLLTITNASGTLFPVTGGTGTVLFTVIGLLLMGGAVAGFAIKKHKNK